MSFLYLTGSAFNLYGRGTVSVSPTAHASFGATYLSDKDPSSPHIAGSVANDSYMRVTYNALTNPGFQTSTLSGWTDNDIGIGASTESATGGRGGTKGLQCAGSSPGNYGSRYQDITVNAGEFRKASFWMQAGSDQTGSLFIRNLRTGNYYNGSTWTANRDAAVSATQNDVAFIQTSITYQVESFDTCRADTVSLRWELYSEEIVIFDDCLDVPGVTFASIHGHNYGTVVSPLVQSSDDASSWTTRATMTIKRPAFFSTFSIIYAEYWQIKLSGTNFEAPYTGEAVLGQYSTSATSPQWGIPKTRAFPGVRTRSPGARHHVYNFATDPPQDIEATFSARTAAAASEIADSIWLRSAQGQNPTIFVPIDTETDVYYGRLIEPHTVQRPFSGVYETTLLLMGDPFPTIGL